MNRMPSGFACELFELAGQIGEQRRVLNEHEVLAAEEVQRVFRVTADHQSGPASWSQPS